MSKKSFADANYSDDIPVVEIDGRRYPLYKDAGSLSLGSCPDVIAELIKEMETKHNKTKA